MVGDEPHIWIIGNATTEFTIKWEGVDYTINVQGLDWAADIKAATLKDLTDAEPAANTNQDKINYDNLTVARDGYDVTISGKVTKKVEDGDVVGGFGTIEVPDGAESKQYALIAWMVDTELHIWAVGNETENFTFNWEGLKYTVDVTGLDWYEEVTRTEAPTRADATGGEGLEEYVFADGTLTIKGPVAEIPNVKNPSNAEARWVGVNIPKPTTDVVESGTIKLTIKEEGKEDVVHKDVTYGEGDPFLYYFGAEPGGRTLTLEIVWNATHKETLVVKYVDTTEPVYGSMTAYPYANGVATKDGNNYTATFSGEIPWYEANTGEGVKFPRAEGNRVGVKISAPADFDTSKIVQIKIGDKDDYTWETIEDGDGSYFEWWPLVTEAGQEFTATIKWNSASEQTFTIKIAEGATLEVNPAVQALIDFLGTAKGHNYGTATNWLDLNKLTVAETTVTADFSTEEVKTGIKVIYDKLVKDNRIGEDGKVTGADNVAKDAIEYAIDSYVMNTFARYMGAIGHAEASPVKTIKFGDAEYTWNSEKNLKASNWFNGEKSLVSEVVNVADNRGIRNVTLTFADETGNSIEVTFKADNVPTKESLEELLNPDGNDGEEG
ncbi:MAG: hypothetical protein GX025_10135, partial [Clostridiales bacterium]|nr:hypothetical protein [Clostridiales bacterium]